ncbi:ABC transporter permease [Georgenia sp. SYP-B2076]|uniref:ABC transporter permease n=1 Tax=Georgenia sp. SYP-B2076 TaxID=2495881 RepID=UPI00197A8563|nr:ABC transporter permease subunit [Georgenia sp. SYP-B2076]
MSASTTAPRLRLDPRHPGVSATGTAAVVVLLGVLLEIGGRARWWDVVPPISTMFQRVGELLGEAQFWSDASRTGLEVAVSLVLGAVLGLLAGITFWKLPAVGRAFEPYLVALYAVPLALFYPFMIVLVGINVWSVIILATLMAAIPMALNTGVGLSTMRPVYTKLGRSLNLSPRQMLWAVALPAAGPFIVAGLRMALVYALIGCVAMEFVTAQAGLGYRIRYLYEIFDDNGMYAYIVVVLLISVALTVLLGLVERLILRGRITR